MYIEPNTIIRILKDVPLDTTYDHTLYFSSRTSQTNYFIGLTKYTFNDQSYQRVRRGSMRIQRKAEDLYDCNYLMFQNSSFGTKWFYAYIKSVEYVNNVTSEITFELDVMQSWFFDYDLDRCYVIREHAQSDAIGAHIEPEPVEVGEQVYNSYQTFSNVWSELCVILGVVTTGEAASSGNIYDGVYCGSKLKAFNSQDVSGLNTELAKYLQAPDSVVNLYMCPRIVVSQQAIPNGGIDIPSGASGYDVSYLINPLNNSTQLDGYTPKNKKLLTYPFTYHQVNNSAGQSLVVRYEFFTNGEPTFKIFGTLLPPVSLVLYPIKYKGSDTISGFTVNNNESITVANFPLCSWNFDAYQAWQAQSSFPIVMSGTANVIGQLAGGLATGNPLAGVGAGLSAFNEIISYIGKDYTASIAADISKGNLNNGSPNACNGMNQFYHGRVSCSAQYARMIDDFFTRFGYQTNRIKIPNTHSRPHWNYVKTAGCTITGSIPCDDARKICSIYDNGITFWKNGSEVGNYSLDNSP